MNTSYIVTARKHLREGLLICSSRSVGVCLMGHPFFAGHTTLHMGLSLLLSGCFAFYDKIECIECVVADRQSVVDSEEARAEGRNVLSKLVFKLLLTALSLLLGFKILSPTWTLSIPMQHDLSLRYGITQLLVSTLVVLHDLLYTQNNAQTRELGQRRDRVKLEQFRKESKQTRERAEQIIEESKQTRERAEQIIERAEQIIERAEQIIERAEQVRERAEEELNRQIDRIGRTMRLAREEREQQPALEIAYLIKS